MYYKQVEVQERDSGDKGPGDIEGGLDQERPRPGELGMCGKGRDDICECNETTDLEWAVLPLVLVLIRCGFTLSDCPRMSTISRVRV